LYPTDAFKTFVGFGHGKWYFATWSNEYRTLTSSTFNRGFAGVVIAILGVDTDPISVDTPPGRSPPLMIVSLRDDSRIDFHFIDFERDGEGKVTYDGSATGAGLRITWGLDSAHNYLAWFFAESKAISLGMKDDSSLVVVVFPWPDDIGSPIISEIALNPEKGYLLTAEFMTPLRIMLTSYTYPGGEITDAAIIMFFDNYGILGARVLAPVTKGSTSYELKGQIPAISGQASNHLGQRLVGTRLEDIGIFPKDVQIL
jgi:hypothetical protein